MNIITQKSCLEKFLQNIKKAQTENFLYLVFQSYVEDLRKVEFVIIPSYQKKPLTKFETEEDKMKANSLPIDSEASMILPKWLTVIDIDNPEEFCKFYGISLGEIEEIATTKTGRGFHIYVFTPNHLVPKGEAYEVKHGDNHLVILPGSRMYHPKLNINVEYKVLNPVVYTIDELPEKFRKVFSVKEAQTKKDMSTEIRKEAGRIDYDRLLQVVLPYYIRGNRQNFVIWLAGWLKKKGIPEEEIWKILEDLIEKMDDEEMKMRLAGIRKTLEKENYQVKGFLGLVEEIGISPQELEQCFTQKEDDEKVIRDEKGKILGPALEFKAKIITPSGSVNYQITFEGRELILKNIGDLKAIIEFTGVPIPRQTPYLEWLLKQVQKPLPVKHVYVQTGWVNNTFLFPTIQETDIWSQHILVKNKVHKPRKVDLQLDFLKDIFQNPCFLTILFVSAFSSVLLTPLEGMSFTVLVTGPSGVGKTLSCSLACNLFYDSFSLPFSSYATSTGIELLLRELSDLPVLLDELKLLKVDAENLIFQVASGVTKIRGTKTLTIDFSTFKNVVFLTSEIAESEVFTRSGAFRRCLHFSISSPEEIHKEGLSALLSVKNCVGAGIEILKWLQKNQDVLSAPIPEEFEVKGVYSKIALPILKATQIICRFFGLEEDYTLGYISTEFDKFNEEFTNRVDIVQRFLELFPQYLMSNAGHFYGLSENPKQVFGKIQKDKVYILSEKFKEFCKLYGFEERVLLRKLEEAEILIPYSDGFLRFMKRLPGFPQPVSCYCLKLEPETPLNSECATEIE